MGRRRRAVVDDGAGNGTGNGTEVNGSPAHTMPVRAAPSPSPSTDLDSRRELRRVLDHQGIHWVLNRLCADISHSHTRRGTGGWFYLRGSIREDLTRLWDLLIE